jgi:hypothetical protein
VTAGQDHKAPGASAGKVRGFIIGDGASLRLFQKSPRLVEIAEFELLLQKEKRKRCRSRSPSG